jgi:signal transduction histidine kinase
MDPRTNQFFEKFTPEGRERLMACLIRADYPDKTFFFHEGDGAEHIFLVLEGEVEILKVSGEHEELLTLFRPGGYFGEVGVLDGYGRSTAARARGAVLVGKIPKGPLMEVLDSESVSVILGLFQQVIAYMRRSNDLFMGEVVHQEKLSLVGEMASSLMHDLRNPVASIRMAADLVGMNHSDEETNHCCNGIRLQCDRLVDMATELLEFSRGETKLHLAPTTTSEFLAQFQTLNEEYFRRHANLEFVVEAKSAELEIDSMRLIRVVQNLVTNAVEAIGTKPGGRIEIQALVDDGIFTLSVSDNGPGIPEAVRGRIFEPFVTYGKKSGTGLGMAIVRNVVIAHGGTVTFSTEIGRGTMFLVQLPQFQPQSAASEDAATVAV